MALVTAIAGVWLGGVAHAAGPYGSIRVGPWVGGAYTNDAGAFSFCGAETRYADGILVAIGQQVSGNWLLSLGLQSWQFAPNTMEPMELTFDGQAQFHLFGKPNTANTLYATLPSAAVEQLRKSRGVALVIMGQVFQLLLNSTGQLLPVISNCVVKSKVNGVSAAGDFSIGVAKPPAAPAQAAAPTQAAATARGPYGSIRVENWIGGAYTEDPSGAFSYCAATAVYAGGLNLSVGLRVDGAWFLGVNLPSAKFTRNNGAAVDLTFDGQAQFHAVGSSNSPAILVVGLPIAAVQQLGKSRTLVLSGAGEIVQANLAATGQVLPIISNCVAKTKASGIAAAGDFSVVTPAQGSETAAAAFQGAASEPKTLVDVSGTGFVINQSGYVLTNNHVIRSCVGDIHGNLGSESPMNMRVVSADETNDLALLQAPEKLRRAALIRGSAVHSGEAVVAIGYPFHGLLTSDFTVTTGIVSSLSGILNNTRFLQISAPVQPGNSGGPLLDMSGNVVGVVSGGLNQLAVAKATGNIPENINFAIKTGAVRDFLDNSGVPYQTGELGVELKAAQVASNARAFTMLISCSANEEAKK